MPETRNVPAIFTHWLRQESSIEDSKQFWNLSHWPYYALKAGLRRTEITGSLWHNPHLQLDVFSSLWAWHVTNKSNWEQMARIFLCSPTWHERLSRDCDCDGSSRGGGKETTKKRSRETAFSFRTYFYIKLDNRQYSNSRGQFSVTLGGDTASHVALRG